ncbi:pentapeptide repeat-containing protein [Streptomyces echinoruber]|uniref:pentapeptide repeat-containing protein n=1 Tax=Streptomyces echinoruber TaxID=68898 RepID=UPI00167ED49E
MQGGVEGADLQGTRGPGLRLTGSRLTRSRLTGSRLTRSRLTGSRLTRSRLTGSRLAGSPLAEARLAEARLADGGGEFLRRRQRSEVPGEFVRRIVLGVGQVVGQGAAVQRVAVLADLRPQVEQTAAGLLAVPRVMQHHHLPDPRQDGVRHRPLPSLRHPVLPPLPADHPDRR